MEARIAENINSELVVQRLLGIEQTPFAIFFAEKLKSNVKSFKEATRLLKLPVNIYFAFKCCPIIPIVECILKNGIDGLEVHSNWELEQSVKLTTKNLLHGCGKSKADLHRAVALGSLVILDGLDEAKDFAALENPGQYGCRLMPEVKSNFLGSSPSKLGMSATEIRSFILDMQRQHKQKPAVLHVHIFQQYRDANLLNELFAPIMELWNDESSSFSVLNIGGGFCSDIDSANLFQIMARWRQLIEQLKGIQQVWMEPGRALTGSACSVFSRVLRIKYQNGVQIVVVDAGTNLLVPIPNSSFKVKPVNSANRQLVQSMVVDGTCSPSSIINHDCNLPALQEGELIEINDSGAYTFSFCNPLFHTPLPTLLFASESGLVSTLWTKDFTSSISTSLMCANS